MNFAATPSIFAMPAASQAGSPFAQTPLNTRDVTFLNTNDSHFLTDVMGRNIILTIPKTSPFDVYLAPNVVIVSYS
ncbi:hypothetical protein [Paraburkholderia sp. J69-1]|uniref:hypothetical protein n=1 Tax=Paraburkholderia sp. J69-1 TaxID=2805436 RepID=UPI002AB7456D|nr:hypothetical protein [Paraburkholderia sp. J69-1]